MSIGRRPAELGGVARDVARALAVADDPERLRPLLFQGDLLASCRVATGALRGRVRATDVPSSAEAAVYARCGPGRCGGPRHPSLGAPHERPLLARGPHRPRHRRLARHRPHDRRRLPQGRCARGLHLGAQGRGLRRDRARAVVARHLRLAAGRRLDASRACRRWSRPTRSTSRRSTSWSTTPARPGARPSTRFPRRAGTRSST